MVESETEVSAAAAPYRWHDSVLTRGVFPKGQTVVGFDLAAMMHRRVGFGGVKQQAQLSYCWP